MQLVLTNCSYHLLHPDVYIPMFDMQNGESGTLLYETKTERSFDATRPLVHRVSLGLSALNPWVDFLNPTFLFSWHINESPLLHWPVCNYIIEWSCYLCLVIVNNQGILIQSTQNLIMFSWWSKISSYEVSMRSWWGFGTGKWHDVHIVSLNIYLSVVRFIAMYFNMDVCL